MTHGRPGLEYCIGLRSAAGRAIALTGVARTATRARTFRALVRFDVAALDQARKERFHHRFGRLEAECKLVEAHARMLADVGANVDDRGHGAGPPGQNRCAVDT